MAKCKDCVHFVVCGQYVTPEEEFPEVGGCDVFTAKTDLVEHGFWYKAEGGFGCSVCDEYEDFTSNFCPNCGAKLDRRDSVK